jgi:hypothetical protein
MKFVPRLVAPSEHRGCVTLFVARSLDRHQRGFTKCVAHYGPTLAAKSRTVLVTGR